MAELILGSVVRSIAAHLVSLASQEIGQAWGVKGELKKLKDTVSAVGALLLEAEKRQILAADVKDWLEKLNDVVYDADDLLDDYSTEALRRHNGVAGGGKSALKAVGVFFSSSNQLIYASKMAHQVKDIRERIDEITTNRVRFQLEGSTSGSTSLVENRVRPETYPFKPETYVIGRDKDTKEVIEFLLNPHSEENVSILPIVGLGGMGKTTLARLTFNDDRVKEHFALKLWVCVSTNFDVVDIVRKIVQASVPDKDLGNPNMSKLHNMLRENLYGKRYLLVLDDVWNENRSKWVDLLEYLKVGAEGTKILVTTRSSLVAKTMAKKSHELRGLPEDESLSLLMETAMKEEHEWRNKSLEMIAKEILKKCGGVPLAIRTIGRLLNSRDTEADWLSFQYNDLSTINQEEGDIMPALKLSYYFLPSHLKQCFAYCSLFPKNYELDPSELVRLWMAQGFIKPMGNRNTLEEVGQDYFMELVWRSFFQDVELDPYGGIMKFKVHDLMHDLAQLVARDYCITMTNSSHGKKVPERARHIGMDDMQDDEFNGFEINKRIRSLLRSETSKRVKIARLDVSLFRNLRAMYLHEVDAKVISSTIGELKHLRCLDLSWNGKLRFLPNSISKLCNLETLNLKGCWKLKTLPAGITKLVNLRHLDISGCLGLTHLPKGIGKLTSLQTLRTFVVGEKGNSNAARLNELSRLTGLRKQLTIGKLERLGSMSSEVDASFSMEKLALEFLGLEWGYNNGERPRDEEAVLDRFRPHPDIKGLQILRYSGSRLPSWISQMHKLVKIEIKLCRRCTHLPPLDQLPFLKRISLDCMSDLEWIELSESRMSQPSFFPSLEELRMSKLFKFRGWERKSNVNRVEDKEDMLPTFSEKLTISISDCPRFSYMHGEQVKLGVITAKELQELRNVAPCQAPPPQLATAVPDPAVAMTFISMSSISLSAVTSLSITLMEDVEHLPLELFQSFPSVQSLQVYECRRLKSLPVRAMLQCLSALQDLEIRACKELDFSIEGKDGDGAVEKLMDDLKMQGFSRLRSVRIEEVEKMEYLPDWFHNLSGLEDLEIRSCKRLKSLPEKLILRNLSTLKTLVLSNCPELDLTDESGDQDDMPNFQFYGPTKLQELILAGMEKMKTLPRWVQHLTSLERLYILGCKHMMALPEWFPQLTSLKYLYVSDCGELSKRCQVNTGDDWPKISHIQDIGGVSSDDDE